MVGSDCWGQGLASKKLNKINLVLFGI